MAIYQTHQRRWFAKDAAAMAGVSVTDIRNWRARSRDWSTGSEIFERAADEGWQRFTLQQIGMIAVLGEASRCGIPLESLSGYVTGCGDSVAFWAEKHAAGADVKTPSEGPKNGSWAQNVRWVVAIRPVSDERHIFFSHTTNSDRFPAWVKKMGIRSFATIDLEKLGRHVAENAPPTDAHGFAGGISDVELKFL